MKKAILYRTRFGIFIKERRKPPYTELDLGFLSKEAEVIDVFGTPKFSNIFRPETFLNIKLFNVVFDFFGLRERWPGK